MEQVISQERVLKLIGIKWRKHPIRHFQSLTYWHLYFPLNEVGIILSDLWVEFLDVEFDLALLIQLIEWEDVQLRSVIGLDYLLLPEEVLQHFFIALVVAQRVLRGHFTISKLLL